MIASPSSFRPNNTLSTLPEPAGQIATQHSWQDVHDCLMAKHAVDLTSANLADFAVYVHCVHQAFGRAEDMALAQHLAQQLLAQPWPQAGSRWTVSQVKQACALAWLHTHGAVAPPVSLDETLYQEAQCVLAQSALGSHALLIQLIRYLGLRLPAPNATRYLRELLAQWPNASACTKANTSLLDLDALATELLTFIWVYKMGLPDPVIPILVRQGVRQLLSSRRAVDFQEQRYSIFPYQVCLLKNFREFSAELTWCRGDAKQALLLYEAYSILQDSELINIAELVGLNTTLRTSTAATEVDSVGFCHGAAGIAQLYSRLYSTSGQQAYYTAYHFWLNRTQGLLPSEATTIPPSLNTELCADLVGVALVLLSTTQQSETGWDVLLT